MNKTLLCISLIVITANSTFDTQNKSFILQHSLLQSSSSTTLK
eukprot:UN00026